MDESQDAIEMRDRLARIRENLARMRSESRESLARLAATREIADDRAATRARDGEDRAPVEQPPAA